MVKKKKKYDGGGPIDAETDRVKDFYKEYLNSPNYLKRLKLQGYESPDQTISDRLSAVNRASVFSGSGGSKYLRKEDKVRYDPQEATKYNFNREDVLSHEFSHTAGSLGYPGMMFPDNSTLNTKEINAIDSRNRLNSINTGSIKNEERKALLLHDQLPSEAKADMDNLRYRLSKDKIYNTGTQDFDQNYLNKAKQKYSNDPNLKRVFDRFNDKDLIYLMNNIAGNNPAQSDTAENGIHMADSNKINYHVTIDEIFSPLKAKDGIHIKPENKGKFNATKKATGKTTEQLTHSSNPVTKKRAVFAKNAAKWHHADDGDEIDGGGPEHPVDLSTVYSAAKSPYKLANTKDDIDVDRAVLNAGLHGSAQDQMQSYGVEHGIKQKSGIFGNIAQDVTIGLSAADAIVPYGRIKKQQVVRPPQAYNPYPYGTNSQAIMERGGKISPEQARSDFAYTQLYDNGGSIPGFMGLPAAKVKDGALPSPSIMRKKKAKNGAYLDKFNDKMQLTAEYADGGQIGDPDVDFVDKLNYMLSSGNRPKGAFTPDQQSLITSGYLWRQQNFNKNPEDIIQGFYSRPVSGNNASDVYRQRLGKIGNSPLTMYRSSPDANSQARQGIQNGNAIASTSQLPAMEDGGSVDVNRVIPHPLKFHYGGGADVISNNPYAGPTMEFKGPSHEDGGIGMSYGGNKVEVEGGETGVVDQDGDFNVMGNMVFPGTNTKFKALSKKIATQENSANRKLDKGSKLMDEADPDDSYDYLRFNSGRALTIGADMRMKRLAGAREKLGDIQKTILDTADRLNIDPDDLSQGKYTAKKGMKINYADGGVVGDPDDGKKLSRSDRNHNPGNIKYGLWAKQHGATGQDKDGFAVFDEDNVGLGAMTSLLQSKGYNNLSVSDAIKKWTAGKPYQYNLGSLASKRVGDLNQDEFNNVVSTMRQGEGTRYGVPSQVTTPPSPTRPSTPISPAPPTIKYNPDQPATDRFHTNYYQAEGDDKPLPDLSSNEPNIPSSARDNKLGFGQVAPEVYSIATNRQVPVPTQKFQPTLFQPYSVSFQDRINNNQDTFSAIAKATDYNPTALSALGAQKYEADNAVKADEFRTNQAISSDITNRNVSLLNDAQLKNLQFADTQMVRQATARSKTKAQTQEALNSVSSKILQNNLENKRMELYEPLFDYRLTSDNAGNEGFTYQGGPATFNYGLPRGAGQGGDDTRRTTITDKDGNLKQTRTSTITPTDEQLKQQKLIMNRRKLYLP